VKPDPKKRDEPIAYVIKIHRFVFFDKNNWWKVDVDVEGKVRTAWYV